MRRFLLTLALIAGAIFSPALAAPDFPNSPTVGQSYEYQGRTYQFNGELWQVAGALGPGVLQEVITSDNASHPAPAGARYAIIECVGGGGGGGGAGGTASDIYAGGGGGSGAYSRALVLASEYGATQNIDAGAAGAAGSSGGNDGGDGSDTSVGSLCVADGGGGGGHADIAGLGPAGVGGLASSGTGDLRVNGNPGALGFYYSSGLQPVSCPGSGGASYFGGGGRTAQQTGSGIAGTSGGGGSGGCSQGANVAGGAGGAGLVVITWFLGESYGTDGGLPPGAFFWHTGSTCPSTALTANGASVSRTTYNRLWAAISGDAVAEGSQDAADYGTGDLSTTFSLMDLTTADRFIRAGVYGTAQNDGTPNITGTFRVDGWIISGGGAFGTPHTTSGGQNVNTGQTGHIDFDASASDANYGAASEVRPTNVAMTPCIAY